MGSKAPTTTSTNSVPPQVLAQYQSVLDKANPIANTPYQPYTGQLTAGLNATQQAAIGGLGSLTNPTNGFTSEGYGNSINGNATVSSASPYYAQAAAGLGGANGYFDSAASSIAGAQPYYQQAASYNDQSTGPLNTAAYLSPYQQNVIDTTMAQVNRQSGVAQNQALGSAIRQGNAFGGDRAGLAAAQLASDQGINTNATLAGLNNQNWAQALSAAQNEAQRYGQAAQTSAGLGNAQLQAGQGYNSIGSNATAAANGLTGVGNAITNQGQARAAIGVQQAGIGSQYVNNLATQYGAALQGGNTQQATDQAALNAQYQQYANATAFPYQQTGWLSNISTGIGSGSGGSTTSVGSAPSASSQILGGLTAGAAILGAARGGAITERASGGAVGLGGAFPMAGGPISFTGIPGDNGGGLIPTIQINQAKLNAPAAVDPNKGQNNPSPTDIAKGVGGFTKAFNSWNTPSSGGFGGASMGDPTSLGGMYARGGLVPGYAAGGMTFEDRYAPVEEALSDNTFQPWTAAPPRQPGLAPPPVRDPEVINPDQPYRLDGRYRDNPDNATPITEARASANYAGTDEPTSLPPEIMRGLSRPAPEAPSQAMAYDLSPPTAPSLSQFNPSLSQFNPSLSQFNPSLSQFNSPPQEAGLGAARNDGTQNAGGLLGRMGVSEDGRQALLSLGLGLLASRSPNFGTALGEAGLGAVGTLGEIQKQRTVQSEKDREYGLQVQRLNQAAQEAQRSAASSPLISDGKGGMKVNPAYIAYKAAEAEATEKSKPVPIGRDERGNVVYGTKRDDGTYVNSMTGQPFRPYEMPGATDGLTGDDFLKAIPASDAAIVKKLVSYDLDPKILSTKGGHRERLLGLAGQYDPNFAPAEYGTRYAVRKDFTSGKSAQNLSSFNTALGHMDTLDKAIDGLHNWTSPKLNAVTGAIQSQFDPKYQAAVKKFETAKTAVIDELTRAFRGTGGNVHDLLQWEKAISTTDSPEALRAAVAQAADLLHSRIEAVGDAYNRGMGTKKEGISLLSPKAQETLHRLEVGKRAETEKPAGTTESGPPAGAVSMLKSNPALKDAFDQKYGVGAAAKVLGQ